MGYTIFRQTHIVTILPRWCPEEIGGKRSTRGIGTGAFPVVTDQGIDLRKDLQEPMGVYSTTKSWGGPVFFLSQF